jgi:hypothetical protein
MTDSILLTGALHGAGPSSNGRAGGVEIVAFT